MKRSWIVLILCAALPIALVACAGTADSPVVAPTTEDDSASTDGTADEDHVRVVVTVGFGAETLVDEVVPLLQGMTALDALQQVAETKTAYGGGFVEAINGIGSEGTQSGKGRQDWFYYMNGFLARSSSAGYVLRPRDVEQWDYHGWAAGQTVSATLQAFPAAMVSGYNGQAFPSIVAFGGDFEEEAMHIATLVDNAGAMDVRPLPIGDLTLEEKQSHNLVVVVGASASYVQELNENRERVGLFVEFEDSTLHAFAANGAEEVYGGSVGLLAAIQSPSNPSGTGVCENIVFLVTGTDDGGVRAAAKALDALEGDAANWPSAIVVDGVLMQVPAWDSVD